MRVQRTRRLASLGSPLTRPPLGRVSLRAGVFVVLGALTPVSTPGVPQEASTANCPAAQLLPTLEKEHGKCRAHRGQCSAFVGTFRQLLPRYDCRRPFDTAPVPAAWLAGDEQLEKYVELLAHLRTPEAKALFGSEEFRGILDGVLAEQYRAKSIAAEKQLRSKR
jgi:hypothetical protein